MVGFYVVKGVKENHFCGVACLVSYPAINSSDKNAALRLLQQSR